MFSELARVAFFRKRLGITTKNIEEPGLLKGHESKYKTDLLAYGPCSNAGDVLIYETFLKLFEQTVDATYYHIRQSKLNGDSPNVVIGPGGLLSGSYKPDVLPDEIILRHLTQEKIEKWETENRKIFCFGTGTNTPFNAPASGKPFSKVSEETIGKLVKAAQRVYLRGSADIHRLQGFCRPEDLPKFSFQPCPSLFLDKIFNIKVAKKDRVAVNLPFMKVSNLKDHPIKRFIDYSHSLGLKVDFLDNHPMDFNPEVYSIFDGTTHSSILKSFYTGDEPAAYDKAQKLYQVEWDSMNPVASRFNGYRFAFGARLHSFLPFVAFETPSVFLASNPIRMAMPMEYFGTPLFAGKLAYTGKNLDAMVDGMIERLKFFVENEDMLVDIIRENKFRLWNVTTNNMNEMYSLMD
ncbi:polysaccharide pyruvyl transferase family protein [Bordetella trematum]|uniref:polysaccharide pyruvyl transferase family protein n=1 Tax=Bordetella trematum TaxID=123899 RepID=UPI000F644B19|nr:polysaccharide pyruvyl transferase family protein [Bordetella trematum]